MNIERYKQNILDSIEAISSNLESLEKENSELRAKVKELTPHKNAEAVKKWVKALRSGEYKQGKNYLKNIDRTFCCLGVACAIAKKEGIIDKNFVLIDKGDLSNNSELIKVKNWLGLRTGRGEFDKYLSLVSLNDDKEFDFKMISDVIESRPEGLFTD